jgi:hypothetical protein
MAGPGPLPEREKVALLFEIQGQKSKDELDQFNKEFGALIQKHGLEVKFKMRGPKA